MLPADAVCLWMAFDLSRHPMRDCRCTSPLAAVVFDCLVDYISIYFDICLLGENPEIALQTMSAVSVEAPSVVVPRNVGPHFFEVQLGHITNGLPPDFEGKQL